jgi:O-antigen ligase
MSLADSMLIAVGAAIALQLVPLPALMLEAVDSHAADVRGALWLGPSLSVSDGETQPISIVPRDTLTALGIFSASALFFWICRRICEEGGAGRIVRATAFIGLVASVGAIVQRAQSSELLWGIWRPLDAGARPYGPFVNRNHFATWLIMACPLVFSYLLARAPGTSPSPLLSQRIVTSLKQLGSVRTWLLASVCVMTLALIISTSRSGLVGLACALTVSSMLMKDQASPAIRRWTVLQAVLLALVAVSFANFDSVMDRFDQTLRPAAAGRGRQAVWADALRMIEDFPLTGTGAGTFGTAVGVYQTAEPGYSIGNAHNHYLQVAAEGGALLVVPATLAMGALFALFRRRLTEDGGPSRLIRVGSISGIAAVLLQSVWETGLRMPANAMLLAVLAAIATHAPPIDPAPTRRTY